MNGDCVTTAEGIRALDCCCSVVACCLSPAQNLGKAKGKRLLYDGVNFSLPRGGVVGIIGANGAGKVPMMEMGNTCADIQISLETLSGVVGDLLIYFVYIFGGDLLIYFLYMLLFFPGDIELRS